MYPALIGMDEQDTIGSGDTLDIKETKGWFEARRVGWCIDFAAYKKNEPIDEKIIAIVKIDRNLWIGGTISI